MKINFCFCCFTVRQRLSNISHFLCHAIIFIRLRCSPVGIAFDCFFYAFSLVSVQLIIREAKYQNSRTTRDQFTTCKEKTNNFFLQKFVQKITGNWAVRIMRCFLFVSRISIFGWAKWQSFIRFKIGSPNWIWFLRYVGCVWTRLIRFHNAQIQVKPTNCIFFFFFFVFLRLWNLLFFTRHPLCTWTISAHSLTARTRVFISLFYFEIISFSQ